MILVALANVADFRAHFCRVDTAAAKLRAAILSMRPFCLTAHVGTRGVFERGASMRRFLGVSAAFSALGTSLAFLSGRKGKMVMLTSDQWLAVIAGVGVLVVALVVLMAMRSSRRRHADLKRRFGPEYDRAVQEHGSIARAEKELATRERRVHKQKLRALSEGDRFQFSSDWRNVQARFVDDPSGAVTAADELIVQVMLARGYSKSDVDQRVADLSVEHARVIDHYRAANVLAHANREGRANTEELRQAFVHYRALFADLLEQPDTDPDGQLQEARA